MQPDRSQELATPPAWVRLGRRLGWIEEPPPPPPEPPETITGFVERVSAGGLSGWALSSRGLPLRFSLLVDGQPQTVHLQRLSRGDVLAAHPEAEPWAGFELRAAQPCADWAAAALNGALVLTVNGQRLGLADPGSRAPESGAPSTPVTPEVDPATQARWRVLRAVNARIASGMHIASAAREVIGELRLDADASQALLHSLSPRLCALDDPPSRALLGEVPGLAPAGGMEATRNAWTGGLAVLGYARAGRPREAARALRQLADCSNGPDWLPTECLHAATRALVALQRCGNVSAEQTRHFIDALLRLCQRLSGDWFSRLHDRELTAALVHALEWALGSNDAHFARGTTRSALRSHGLCPVFWDLAADLVDRSPILMEARGHWLAVQQAARPPSATGPAESVVAVARALDFMAARGNPEAAWFRRELTASSAPESGGTSTVLWPSFAEIASGSPCATLHHQAGPEIPASGLLLISVVRNERLVLPHFLAHYRALGIPHFAFIDNGSTDGTRELLAAEPDITLFHAPQDYRDAAFGVAWQQAVLGHFCVGRWVLLVDADEFLVYPGCESTSLPAFVAARESEGADAVFTDLVDMYPEGSLDSADFSAASPFEAAPCFDREPLLRWHLGGGRFCNAPSYVSALRHRLVPDAEPNAFLSQKCTLLRYAPWVRLGHGIHDVANVNPHSGRVWLAHFKYHAAFADKVRDEIRRGQHFGAAREYRHYADILDSHRGFRKEGVSVRYAGSPSFSQHAQRVARSGPP